MPKITRIRPNVATTSPIQMPVPSANVGRRFDQRQVEHGVGDDCADAAADDLRRDVRGRIDRHARRPSDAVHDRHHRVQMSAGDGTDRQDDRRQRGCGRDRVLEQLDAGVGRQATGRDARTDDGAHQQRGAERLGTGAPRQRCRFAQPAQQTSASGVVSHRPGPHDGSAVRSSPLGVSASARTV